MLLAGERARTSRSDFYANFALTWGEIVKAGKWRSNVNRRDATMCWIIILKRLGVLDRDVIYIAVEPWPATKS